LGAKRFRRAGGVERQQLRWVAWAAALAVLGAVVALGGVAVGATALVNWAISICFAVLPVAIAAAILRYRLYDLDRIISRSLAWGLLTLLLGGDYAGIVLGLGQLLGRESALVVAAATLAVAALFQPARRRIQAAVDRRFNRRRYDTAKTVEAFRPGSVTRSTWTRSRSSCWRWSTRPCSRPRCRCGFDRLAVRPRTSAPVAHPERLGSWRLPGPFAQLCEPVRRDGEPAAVREAGRDTSKAARAVSAAAPQAR
jgi:hypothetical protein